MSLDEISNNCFCFGPELFGTDSKATIDIRTDLWSLGIAIFALVKPNFGFQPKDVVALFMKTVAHSYEGILDSYKNALTQMDLSLLKDEELMKLCQDLLKVDYKERPDKYNIEE